MKKRPEGPPFAVVAMVRNAIRIQAFEDDPRLSGVYVEQGLSDARALVPDLECVEADPHADRKLLRQLAHWCERYTPLVALSGEDGLFLDITGCSHLLGGDRALLDDLAVRLRAQGFSARLAVADTPGAAWALARHGENPVSEPDSHQALLEPLPLSTLRLRREQVRELNQVGFKTIGCLAKLPRAPVTARFGSEVLQRLDQAMGDVDEVLSPLRPAAEFVSEKRFASLIVHEEDIKATISKLASTLEASLEKRALGMRECTLALFRADGEVVSLSVSASSPIRQAGRIAGLFGERLAAIREEWDAGFGFDVIRLSITRTDVLEAEQCDMIGADFTHKPLNHLLDRMSARLGAERVQFCQVLDGHVPERRIAFRPAIHGPLQHFPLPDEAISEVTVRPVVLFERPEPANVIASVPEGPPVRFRWRKTQYEVVRSEGPERIACEWWKDGRAARTRDYFRVETAAGYRLWIFRHGLYGRETDDPGWYVHGLFA